MILSDREIQAAIKRDAIRITAGFGFKDNEPSHPGNALQLEIWHVGPLPISLVPGMPICQLIFEEVHGTPEKGYAGIFADQGV